MTVDVDVCMCNMYCTVVSSMILRMILNIIKRGGGARRPNGGLARTSACCMRVDCGFDPHPVTLFIYLCDIHCLYMSLFFVLCLCFVVEPCIVSQTMCVGGLLSIMS